MDVFTFQVETARKLLTGKALAVPDLSVFLSLVVAEAVVVSQLAIPAALAGIEEAKRRGWIK